MESPLISVVMPVFNAQLDLREAINSILAQTFKDFELIVIDDGSIDDSVEIILAIDDSRIRLLRHSQNKGLVASLNLGLLEAKGQFIARMDADDISNPDRLMSQIHLMQAMNLDICGSHWAQIDAQGRQFAILKAPSSYEEVVATLATTVPYAHGSVMMRKSFLDKHGLQYQKGYGEDYDLWIRFFECGAKFGAVDEILYFHRQHSDSITATKFKEQALASRMLRRKFVESNLVSCNQALRELEQSFPKISKSVQVHCLYLAYRYFVSTGRSSTLLKLLCMSSPGVAGRFVGRLIRA